MSESYRHRRLVITLALPYLFQGIPIDLAVDVLPTLPRQDGASLQVLALLPLMGLSRVVKFLWAPWVGNHWSYRLGRRCSWVLPMQCIVLARLLGLATPDLGAANAGWAAGLLTPVSLVSMTQDIATDGMAVEHFSGELLAEANTVQIAGATIGSFGNGAGSLILVGCSSQRMVFLVVICVSLASLCCVLALKRSNPHELLLVPVTKASSLRFLRRPLVPSLLALVLLSATTAMSSSGLSKLYLSDVGWTLQDIDRLGISGGLVTVSLNCDGGAWLVRRIGPWRGFVFGVTSAGCSVLLWCLQTGRRLASSEGLTWTCMSIGSLATDITSAAILIVAMRFAGQGGQAGTDATAAQNTRDFGEMLAFSFLVGLTVQIGYVGGFLTGSALTALALLFTPRLQVGEGYGE